MSPELACSLAAFVCFTPAIAGAQTPATTTATTQATAAAPAANAGWGGTVNVGAQFSDGTQQQTVLSTFSTIFYERGRTPTALHVNTRARYDLSYSSAKKPEQDRITTSELHYGELRLAANAKQVVSGLGGSVKNRGGTSTRLWLYGTAAWYHHIAFDLDLQQAYGVGLAYDLPRPAGLAFAADVRHVDQHFNNQPNFASWAVRIHQSYSYAWNIGSAAEPQTIVFAESLELVPMFESSDAFQSRWLVRLILPVLTKLTIPIAFGSDYLRNAPPGFRPKYWKSTVGVEFNFGPE